MSYITAYGVLIEPLLGRLPVYECIESLYDHVQEFCILDCSKYDHIDLSKYGKVRKHVKSLFNPFDNPFGSAYSSALKLVQSDTALFLDFDELWEFKNSSLQDIIKRYPMQDEVGGAGIAFSLRNYYCSRHFVMDACSTKGAHVFRTTSDLAHDSLRGYWQHRSRIRRTNNEPDTCDGVRVCDENFMPINHYEPVPIDEVIIHHTSHLDFPSKVVRNLLQYNHTSTLDLVDFFPYDMRLRPEVVQKIYDCQVKEIENGDIKLYAKPESIEYEGNKFLDQFVSRCNVAEFDPTKVKDYENWR